MSESRRSSPRCRGRRELREGVVAISPSFADELFAKVPEDAVEDGRVRFVDLDDGVRRTGRDLRVVDVSTFLVEALEREP